MKCSIDWFDEWAVCGLFIFINNLGYSRLFIWFLCRKPDKHRKTNLFWNDISIPHGQKMISGGQNWFQCLVEQLFNGKISRMSRAIYRGYLLRIKKTHRWKGQTSSFTFITYNSPGIVIQNFLCHSMDRDPSPGTNPPSRRDYSNDEEYYEALLLFYQHNLKSKNRNMYLSSKENTRFWKT